MSKHVKVKTVMKIDGRLYQSALNAHGASCERVFDEWCNHYEEKNGGGAIYRYPKDHERCFNIYDRVKRRTGHIFARAFR